MPAGRPGMETAGSTPAADGLQSGPIRRYIIGMPETFEAGLQSRVDETVDACTRCGKCVEACPDTGAAGLETEARDNPVGVITGILDILRHGEGSEAARNWASGCVFRG